jgi:hypothetical protein
MTVIRQMVARAALLFLAVLSGPLVLAAQPASVPDMAEEYFQNLRNAFEKTAGANALKSRRWRTRGNYFTGVMRRYPTFHTFVLTNTRGRVITHVVRGSVPRKTNKAITRGNWYSFLKNARKARAGIWFEKDNGRYYLVWGKPVTAGRKGQRFMGAVAAKIDLWDSFHKFAKRVEQPFLSMINGKVLYSHEWTMKAYKAYAIKILGIKKAAILVHKAGAAAAAAEPAPEAEPAAKPAVKPAAKPAAKGAAKTAAKALSKKKAGGGGGFAVLIVIFALAITAGIVGAYIISKRKRERLLREILQGLPPEDESDRFSV